MKTFLNVLYRRILYKIPLKLLLVLLVVFAVLFACFSKAENVEDLINYSDEITNYQLNTSYSNLTKLNGEHELGTICVKFTKNSGTLELLRFGFTMSSNGTPTRIYEYANFGYYICGDYYLDGYITIKNNYSSLNVDADIFVLNALLQTSIPFMSSLECQQNYSLIPIESVDQNYCTTNNLCPSCPVCPDIPVFSGDLSELYINNILHVGAPTIIMNIPDEIDWDYAYTQGGQNMNIDIVGYNVDYEKIDSIVEFQNYKPSSEDFQRIIGLLAPYTKIIVFFVFLFIVWAWIKKPFKSKKL